MVYVVYILTFILFHYHLLMNTTHYLVVCSILMVINDGQKLLVLFWSIYRIIQDYFCSSFDWQAWNPCIISPVFYRPHLVQLSWTFLYCFCSVVLSPALSAGEFWPYCALLCISVASSLIIMHFTVFSYMSLLLLYILYSAFLCDLVARMVSS